MTDYSGPLPRRSTTAGVPDPTGAVIGLDVGGTKVLGVAVADGGVVARSRAATPIGAAEILEAVASVVNELVTVVGPPAALGVGLPGLVDRSGVLRYGPNVPGVVDLDIRPLLARRFGVPVVVENDAACAAVAEHRLGAARGRRHAAVVTLGTGIGGGLIIHDRLYVGANGYAGEPGHTTVDPDGPRCACGARGCWESLASGAGLTNLARRLVDEGRGSGIVARAGGIDAIRGEHVVEALRDGDPDAVEVVDRFAGWVAIGVANLVAVLDPEIVVIGGGLSEVSERFLDPVVAAVPGLLMGAGHRPVVPVVAATLGPEAGAIGAAVLAADAVGETGAVRGVAGRNGQPDRQREG